jgi:hypothetical protein
MDFIPGWNNVPGSANEFWAAATNSYGLSASPSNGSGYWVDLTGQGNNKPYGGIEQNIATVAGEQYVLSFDLGASTLYNSAGLGAAALTASAAGASQLFTLAPNSSSQWQSETLLFTAVSSATAIEFLADSGYTSKYTGLDNVAVAPVPLPASLVLFGGALCGLTSVGASRRMRKVD